MHIEETNDGTFTRTTLGIAHASVLMVVVAHLRPPTWCVTLVLEASPVLRAKTDTQNRVNGRAPHSEEPSRWPCFWVPKLTPRTGFASKVETGLVYGIQVGPPTAYF